LTNRTLISIEDFPNVGPGDTAYPQAYNLKLCMYCNRTATKIALYDNGNDIIVQERYCNRHIGVIKKHYDAGFQSMTEAYYFKDKEID
jgi:hypothetical protein